MVGDPCPVHAAFPHRSGDAQDPLLSCVHHGRFNGLIEFRKASVNECSDKPLRASPSSPCSMRCGVCLVVALVEGLLKPQLQIRAGAEKSTDTREIINP